MKKLQFLALSVFLLLVNTADVFAGERIQKLRMIFSQYTSNVPPDTASGGEGAIGAPLDGGLLTLLAAAGVTYFVARRKKKNKE